MSSAAQIAANRANAKLSSGPKTAEGKAASAMNSQKLGLAARTFAVLPYESQEDFDAYTKELLHQYGPANTMEWTLVCKIAQHHWLSQRSIVAQDNCFEAYGPTVASPEKQRELALYMRYQTTHDRAFHKSIRELERMQADRRRAAEAQAKAEAAKAAETRKVAMHTVRLEIATQKRDRERSKTTAQGTPAITETNKTAIAVPIAA
jgi:hypothetical protein